MRYNSNLYIEVRFLIEVGFISSMRMYFLFKFNLGSPFMLIVAVIILFIGDY